MVLHPPPPRAGLHPSRYRTQMCTDGSGCKRRVCFFAHSPDELRKPEEDAAWLTMQDEDAAGARARVRRF